MRIMHFAGGGDIGGAKTHILSLGAELAKENVFRLVSFRPGAFAEEAIENGLDVIVAPHAWNLFACFKLALQAVDDFKPDVLHCHGAKANIMGVMVRKLRHIPVVTTVHSDPKLDYMGSPLRQVLFGTLNSFALKHMDFYMAVASTIEERLIERGCDPQRIFRVYNGMDFSADMDEHVGSHNAQGDIVVGIAARLTPIKNIPTLLQAFAQAWKKDARLRLKIAGTGEEEESLKALAQQLGIAERVDFVGWVSDMRGFFDGVHINVLSSFSEGFPYSLLEGAREHCAAIATAVGGVPELIVDGETGYLFAPEDVDTLATYMCRLAGDDALRMRMAEQLYLRAKAGFSLQKMCETQKMAYEKVIHRSKMRGIRQGAVICGAYGRGNAGDEAILQAIVSQMRSIDADIPLTVMSRQQLETRLKHRTNAIYTFDIWRFIRILRKTKVFINGGGSLIQDVTSSRSLYFYLFTLWAARICGCRVIMYGCGIGPIIHKRNIAIAARILSGNVDVITLRDSYSWQVLADMNVSRPIIQISADPTVTLQRADNAALRSAFAREHIPEDRPKIAFCLRNWSDFSQPAVIAEVADYAWERYGFLPVFIPVELPHDVMAAERTISFMSAPYHVCRQRYTVEELISMLGSMQMVVGMRLHSLIFATLGQAPVIGLSYDVKVDSFIHDIGSTACVPIRDIDKEKIIHFIDEIAAGGCARTRVGLERLQQGEAINIAAARKLLEL